MSTHILIIDDEPNIVLSLSYALSREGFAVDSATDGQGGLALAHRVSPTIIILDIMLPGINGYEVCAEIRAHAKFADTRIIMLSAKGRDDEVERGLAMGADLYLTKPFVLQELLDHLHTLARH